MEWAALRAPDETSSSLVRWKLRPRIWVTPFEAKALSAPPAIGWHHLSRTNRGRRLSLRTHSPGVLLLPRPPAFAWVLAQTVVPGLPTARGQPVSSPRESIVPLGDACPFISPALLARLAPAAGRCSLVLQRGKRRLLLLLCLLLIPMLWVPPDRADTPDRSCLGVHPPLLVATSPLPHWHPPPNTRTKPSRSLSLKTRGLSRRVCPPPSPPSIARHHLPEGATWLCGLDHRHRHRHRHHRHLHSDEQFHLSPFPIIVIASPETSSAAAHSPIPSFISSDCRPTPQSRTRRH